MATSVRPERSRSASKSYVTLPEHTKTRVTAEASTLVSTITGSKVPEVKSATEDVAALSRSIDFGVKTISGL